MLVLCKPGVVGKLLTKNNSPYSSSSLRPVETGLVQVFTGNGKGKTTAALGTVLRALGHGLRVFIAVFMKGDYPYGEWVSLSRLENVDIARFGSENFIDPENVKPEEKESARQALATAREAMLSGNYNLIVLDEVNIAVSWKLISLDEVIQLIRDKPETVELILTGRYADKELLKIANLVTEMQNIKHPFEQGIKARKGFEY